MAVATYIGGADMNYWDRRWEAVLGKLQNPLGSALINPLIETLRTTKLRNGSRVHDHIGGFLQLSIVRFRQAEPRPPNIPLDPFKVATRIRDRATIVLN